MESFSGTPCLGNITHHGYDEIDFSLSRSGHGQMKGPTWVNFIIPNHRLPIYNKTKTSHGLQHNSSLSELFDQYFDQYLLFFSLISG